MPTTGLHAKAVVFPRVNAFPAELGQEYGTSRKNRNFLWV